MAFATRSRRESVNLTVLLRGTAGSVSRRRVDRDISRKWRIAAAGKSAEGAPRTDLQSQARHWTPSAFRVQTKRNRRRRTVFAAGLNSGGAGLVFQSGEVGESRFPLRPTHALRRPQACANGRAFGLAEYRATHVRQQLHAGDSRGLAVRHPGDRRADRGSDAARATIWPALHQDSKPRIPRIGTDKGAQACHSERSEESIIRAAAAHRAESFTSFRMTGIENHPG